MAPSRHRDHLLMIVYAVIFIGWTPPTMSYLPTENTDLDRIFLPFVRRIKDAHTDLTYNTRFVDQQRRVQRAQALVPTMTAFPCQDGEGSFRSATRPTSVHALRPGDIDIIASMGDSLTAGNGAIADSVISTFLYENRGISWTGGSTADWRSYVTLPNIMRAFNPNLIGFALPGSFNYRRSSQFNVAEAGAVSQDMPLQARNLVKRLRSDSRVDIANDWKLVTIMIGSNDICSDMCYGNWWDLPERHRKDMREALGILKKELPRTLVNFVLQPDLEILINIKKKPAFCDILQLVACPCLIGRQFSRVRPQLLKVMEAYRRVEKEIPNDPLYTDRDDFTVVLQPFTDKIFLPDRQDDPTASDLTYLAPDCFHLSQKAYATAAMSLWNNLMEPVGNKSTSWTPLWQKFLCPTKERPFIATQLNS